MAPIYVLHYAGAMTVDYGKVFLYIRFELKITGKPSIETVWIKTEC